MSEPVAGRLYRHYKGGLYRVICLAKREEESHVEVVVYRSIVGVWVWTRTVESWREPTEAGSERFHDVASDA